MNVAARGSRPTWTNGQIWWLARASSVGMTVVVERPLAPSAPAYAGIVPGEERPGSQWGTIHALREAERAARLAEARAFELAAHYADVVAPVEDAQGQRVHTCGSVTVDPEKLLPKAELVVHVTDESLREGTGLVRVERLKALLIGWISSLLDGLGPLSRRQHRAKTHGGWQADQIHPGVFLWRSPLGTVSITTPSGSWTLHIPGAT